MPTLDNCPRFKPLVWQKFTLDAHRDYSNVFYDALILPDGTVVNLGVMYPAQELGLPDMLNTAIQLDGNANGAAYKVMVNDATLLAWE